MRRRSAAWLALGALGACDGTAPTATMPPVPAPALEPASCDRTLVPPGRDATCGLLRVPERPGDPASGALELRVAVLHAIGAPAPDPVLFLAGGPGASAVATALYYAGWVPDPPVAALLARRDVVAIDLRGTGGSRPALGCPDVAVRALPERAGDSDDFPAAGVRACRERLLGDGVALDHFGTAAAAEDVELVRRALGVARWNVVGSGHGGRVALELARAHAATIRALVLDATAPPAADPLAEQGPALAAALESVFAGCERQPQCKAAFPDLRGALDALFARLEAAPADVTTHGAAVRVTGRALMEALAGLLRDPTGVRQLPMRLHQAASGDLSYVAAALGAPRGQGSMGTDLSVVCAEQMPSSSAQAIEARAAALPAAVRGALASRFYPLACPVWNVPPAPASLRDPVRAAVPALLLAGEVDPVSPPVWTDQLAATLPRAHALVLRGHGHDVALSPCGSASIAAFLDAPDEATVAPACANGEALYDTTTLGP